MPHRIGLVVALALAVYPLWAQQPAGRVHNIKVLSDKVDDVTTVDNIVKSFTRPGMSDADRSRGIWQAIVKYRHQTPPPDEHLSADWEAHDPVKIFNVYGYCMCCCCSALVEGLNRHDGREARGRILTGHSVPEVFYAGGWHMYDASLINYFPKPGSGALAGVDDVAEAVAGWYAKNPGYQKNEAKLRQLMQKDGWTGWKTGPELLNQSPFLTQGWYPARTHGWYATMIEYDRKCEVYEYGYHLGHKAVLSLRPGESFLREAGNRGLHINGTPGWDMLKARAPEGDLVYLKEYFPGYRGGVVGNGVHRYAPDFGSLTGENLISASASPFLRPKDASKAGVAVIDMTSPYVYLGGKVTLKIVRKTLADRVVVSLSTNQGRNFTPIHEATSSGEVKIDISESIRRRYACWLKLEITASSPGSAGIDALIVENDIQHAPRTLPWLSKGSNTITVAADGDTAMASRAVACRITPDAAFNKNESTRTMGVVFENLDVKDGSCWWKGGVGRMTVPIETPGDLTGLRFGAQVRARGDKDAVKMLVSFDDGKSWKGAGKIAGPTAGKTEYFRFSDVPAGARKALLRYELTGNNTIGIFSFRADADYRDPVAADRPFEVIHRWREGGQEKSHREAVAKLPHRYTIQAGDAPEMASVTIQMPTK